MKLRWTQYASDQLDAVVDNLLERRGLDAARLVTDQLLHRARRLRELPWSAPKWVAGQDETFRRLVVDDFVILYRVDKLEGWSLCSR